MLMPQYLKILGPMQYCSSLGEGSLTPGMLSLHKLLSLGGYTSFSACLLSGKPRQGNPVVLALCPLTN